MGKEQGFAGLTTSSPHLSVQKHFPEGQMDSSRQHWPGRLRKGERLRCIQCRPESSMPGARQVAYPLELCSFCPCLGGKGAPLPSPLAWRFEAKPHPCSLQGLALYWGRKVPAGSPFRQVQAQRRPAASEDSGEFPQNSSLAQEASKV